MLLYLKWKGWINFESLRMCIEKLFCWCLGIGCWYGVLRNLIMESHNLILIKTYSSELTSKWVGTDFGWGQLFWILLMLPMRSIFNILQEAPLLWITHSLNWHRSKSREDLHRWVSWFYCFSFNLLHIQLSQFPNERYVFLLKKSYNLHKFLH